MATTYQSPGVYIEEVERGIKPIQALGTSTAAFIGITAEASRKVFNKETGKREPVEQVLNKAVLVTSWKQFTDIFGDFIPGAYLPDAVYGYFANGGGPCYITSLRALREAGDNLTAAAVVIPTRGKSTATSFKVTARHIGSTGNQLVVTIQPEEGDLFTMRAGEESISGLSMKKGPGYIGDAPFQSVVVSEVGSASALPQEGSYPLTGGGELPLSTGDYVGNETDRTGLAGLKAQENIRLIACPDLMAGYDGSVDAQNRVKQVQEAMISHCKEMRYRFAVLDTPPDFTAQQVADWRSNFLQFDTSYAALYYPWIQVADLQSTVPASKTVPPSGHILGVYNRSDSERGVHKAPANEVIANATGLELHLTKGEQDILNPIGVNCLRDFPGQGIRIWGGRTLSKTKQEWRYINVRRLFIMVESSIDAGLQWVVFEPNDSNLWGKVRRDVSGFLRMVWRSGALFGSTPEQAFYVKCDEDLNTLEVRNEGMLIIEVGLAPVRPAEFVIFRITQWAGANAEA